LVILNKRWSCDLLRTRQQVGVATPRPLANLTTRKPHPGRHRVDVLLKSRAVALGEFLLSRAK